MFHLLDMIFLVLVFHVTIAHPIYILLLFTMLELFSVTLGVMICCIVKTESVANQIQSIVISILAILGGVIFSLDAYRDTIRTISRISPVKWIVEASFQIIYDHNFHLFLPAMLIMAICVAIMIGVCKLTFKKENCIC